jgi:hypothetical protein
MKSSEILKCWRAVSALFMKTTTWLALLHIASHGDKGVTNTEWAEIDMAGTMPSAPTLREWEKAGIVTVEVRKIGWKNQHEWRYRITQKGLRLLRVEDEPSTEGVAV